MMIRSLSGCSDLEPVSRDELADWSIASAFILDPSGLTDLTDPSGLTDLTDPSGLTGLGLSDPSGLSALGLSGLTGLGLSGLTALSALTATISFDFE